MVLIKIAEVLIILPLILVLAVWVMER